MAILIGQIPISQGFIRNSRVINAVDFQFALGAIHQSNLKNASNLEFNFGNFSYSVLQLEGVFTQNHVLSEEASITLVGLIHQGQAATEEGLTTSLGLIYSSENYQNYLSSLARFFGVDAKQDANKLYISKKDLLGLTPQNVNSAESLLTALLLTVIKYESNSLLSKVFIELWKIEYIQINSLTYIRYILLINLYLLVVHTSRGELQKTDLFIQPSEMN